MSITSALPRILLLGVQGQLGWELRRSLRPLGELVCAARSAATGDRPIDLADAAAVRALVREMRPRLIVNAAAYSLVDQAEREPEAARAVNAVAPGVLQEEANACNAALLHYSTDYVFDGGGTRPWTETDRTNPLGVYGATKRDGELAIAAAGGAYAILRTSWVYGIHGANFVKKILKLAAEREQLRIVADQIGAPTSARYLADVSAQMLAQARGDFAGLLRERGGIFHCCAAGETSWHGFASRVIGQARAAGANLAVKSVEPIPSSEYPTPARRPFNSRMSCERLRQAYGLTAPTWEAALDDTLPLLLKYERG